MFKVNKVAGQVVDTTKYKYDRVKVRGPDGVARYTAGTKDAIAKSLFGISKKNLLEIAKSNGLKLDAHYKARNDGHFRMIVGQALRSVIHKGGKVTIGDVVIVQLDQKVSWPKGFAEEKKGTHDKPIRKHPSANRIKD